MYFSTKKIREIFIKFFENKGHFLLKSSSLIPKNDNTILFTNSGMNQFKNIFLGLEEIKYKRVVTIQKCIRAGGKHNDIDQVGYTSRHHTFFEMLGNFSFGDYFKKESIEFAWELLTENNWLNLPKDKFLITVYHEDEESYNIWNKIGLSNTKIIKVGDKNKTKYLSDNFWQMSEFGPCGPSSEIFYDISYLNKNNNKIKNKRYVEIWNLVFMQFNKCKNGILKKLPCFSVDTGMGLERISSILQEVNSNYKIDVFRNLIDNIKIKFNISNDNCFSLKVISDHIRSAVFIINDGIIPSNEGHGYVLRKIIRRAISHGKILKIPFPFFFKIVDLIKDSIEFYSYDNNFNLNLIKNIIFIEEEKFEKTVNKGILILNNEINKNCYLNNNFISGNLIFKLYDTYGLSINIIKEICLLKNVHFDNKKFNYLMKEQKDRSKNNSKFL